MSVSLQNLRSFTPGVEPASLLPGQLCFNLADKILFVGNGSNFKTDFEGNQVPGIAGEGWYSMPMDLNNLGSYYIINPEVYGDIPVNGEVLTWDTALNHPVWAPGGSPVGDQVYVTNNGDVAAAPGATISDKITAALGVVPSEGEVTIVVGLPGETYEGLYFFTGATWVLGAHYAYPEASSVPYDNATSGLAATDVQGAIDEIAADYVPNAAFTASGDLLVGSGAGSYAPLAAGPADYILASDGAGSLQWVQQSQGDVTGVTGTAPITVDNTDPQNPVVGVDAATTLAPGVVQLNNTTSSSSTTEALTAAQGKALQDQIDALVVTSNLTFAGTFDASTGLVDSVSVAGTTAGFVVGNPVPTPAPGNADHFVIVDVAGNSGPAGAPPYHVGDWFLSDGSSWQLLNVGFQSAYATTATPGIVQLATDAEAQAGVNTTNAVVPSALQSKLSDSVSTTSSTTIASSTAVKTAYDAGIQGQTDAAGAQADATQALTDAAAAQADATQALADAGAAQADATQALADAAAAQATADAAIPDVTITAKGDLIAGTGAATYSALPVGTNGQVLAANSACSTGLEWITNAPDGVASVSGTSPITVDNTDPANPVVGIDAASTTQSGAVQLNDTVTSTSTSEAATANAVKTAYDAALNSVQSVSGTFPINVDNTDPQNPVVSLDPGSSPWVESAGVISPLNPGSVVDIPVGAGIDGLTVSDSANSYYTRLKPSVLDLADNVQSISVSAGTSVITHIVDSLLANTAGVVAQDETATLAPYNINASYLSLNGVATGINIRTLPWPQIESWDSMNINIANFNGALGVQAAGLDLVLIGGDNGGGVSYMQTQPNILLEALGPLNVKPATDAVDAVQFQTSGGSKILTVDTLTPSLKVGDGGTAYTLPLADGSAGYILSTDGAGTASWVVNAPDGVASVSGTSPITVDNTDPVNPVVGIDAASTTQTGAVQLNDTVTSTSTSEAATANAAKTAYDAGVQGQTDAAAAQATADAAIPQAGGPLTGELLVNGGYIATPAGDILYINAGAGGGISLNSPGGTVDATGEYVLIQSGSSDPNAVNFVAANGGIQFDSTTTVGLNLVEELLINGDGGTAGYILQSNGTGAAPTWVANAPDGVQGVTGTAPITVDNTDPANPIVGVDAASTTAPGVVQLNDTVTSTSTTEALTANQGYQLQQQIDALAVTSNITLAGTFDASTGLVDSVTSAGTAAGFVVGNALPAAAAGNIDYFVIVDVQGSTGPAGTPPYHIGDWFLSDGTSWQFLNVGFQAPSATTSVQGVVQLATDAEVQAGLNTDHAVVPSSLQSKLSDSTSTTSSTTIASSTAVKSAYDLANAALPKAGGTMTGDITFSGAGNGVVFQDASTVEAISNSVSLTSSVTAASSTAVKLAYDTAVAAAASGSVNGITSDTVIFVNSTDGNDSTGQRGTTKPYLTITAALAAASEGDTIFLSPGTFIENVTFSKGVNMVGTMNDQALVAGTKIQGNFTVSISGAGTKNWAISHVYFISTNSTPPFTVSNNSFGAGGLASVNNCTFTQQTSTSTTQYGVATSGTWTRSLYFRECTVDGNIHHNAGTAAGASGYVVFDRLLGVGNSDFYIRVATGTIEFRNPSNTLASVFQTGGVVLIQGAGSGITPNGATTTTVFGGTGFSYKGSAASAGTGTVYFSGESQGTGKVDIGANLIYGWTNLVMDPAGLTVSGSAIPYTTAVPAAASAQTMSQQRPRLDLLKTTSSVTAANQVGLLLDNTTGAMYSVTAYDAGTY